MLTKKQINIKTATFSFSKYQHISMITTEPLRENRRAEPSRMHQLIKNSIPYSAQQRWTPLLRSQKHSESSGPTRESLVFQHTNPEVTLHYLKKYLNQVLVQNCRLLQQNDKKDKQIQFLKEIITKKDHRMNQIIIAKKDIEKSIKTVVSFNRRYLEEIQKQRAEIHELKSFLANNIVPMSPIRSLEISEANIARNLISANTQLYHELEVMKARYVKLDTKYKALKEQLQIVSKEAEQSEYSETSMISSGSMLDQMKRYVHEAKNRYKKSNTQC